MYTNGTYAITEFKKSIFVLYSNKIHQFIRVYENIRPSLLLKITKTTKIMFMYVYLMYIWKVYHKQTGSEIVIISYTYTYILYMVTSI